MHDIKQQNSWLGLAIFDTTLWGQGWGRKIITAVSNYALKQLQTEEVLAAIDPQNVGSRHAFAKSGFHLLVDAKLTRDDGVITEIWQRKLNQR